MREKRVGEIEESTIVQTLCGKTARPCSRYVLKFFFKKAKTNNSKETFSDGGRSC